MLERAFESHEDGAEQPRVEGRPVHLVMGPIYNAQAGRPGPKLRIGSRYRWAYENGHPGRCGPDCWHSTPEAGLDCFRGR